MNSKIEEKASVYLQNLIEIQIKAGIQRLPPLRILSSQCGVSHVTLLKALSALRSQGVVYSRRGSGIFISTISNQNTPEPTVSQTQPRAKERICALLERQLLDGTLGPTLPPLKTLRARLGTSHKTLLAGLGPLIESGVLLPFGKTYRLRFTARPPAHSRIALIAFGDTQGNLQVLSPRMIEHFQTTERLCARHGLGLELFTRNSATDQLLAQNTPSAPVTDFSTFEQFHGIMVWSLGMTPYQLDDLLGRLGSCRRPVALLNEDVTQTRSSVGKTPRNVNIFNLATNIAAGESMGRYLRTLGHTHAAYISPAGIVPWSLERKMGIVRTFCSENNNRTLTGLELQARGQGDLLTRLPFDNRQNSDMALNSAYNGDTVHRMITEAHELLALRDTLDPLLDQLLLNKQISIWVASSDSTALICLDFLHRRTIAVPHQISVAGFDDSAPAFLHRLTSFNFGGSAAIEAMIRSILDPASPLHRRHKDVTLDGFVSPRATTAQR